MRRKRARISPRRAAAELEDEHHQQHVLPAHERVGAPRRDPAPEPFGERLARGHRDDVGGRALEHRHVLGPARRSEGTSVTAVAPLPITTTRLPAQSRSSGQCCGWTICPPKRSLPAKAGRVALVVAVVAGAHVQEAAGELQLSPVSVRSAVTVQRASLGGPARADRAVGEADHPARPRARAAVSRM